MLVLTRKVGQKLVIGDDITVVINRISGNRVSVGIEAPKDVHIVRGELHQVREEFRAPQSGVDEQGAVAPDLTFDSFSAHAPR